MNKININLRKLLINDYFYYILILVTLIYAFIYLKSDSKSIYDIKEQNFIGIITKYDIKGDKITFILDAKEPIRCSYYFKTENKLNEFKKKLKIGKTVSINGTLSIPKNNTIPNNFNYKNYLKHNGINFTCIVKKIEFKKEKIPFKFRIKNAVLERIYSLNDTKNYLLTFIIGDKSLLDEDTFENYRKNGVTHLFAISGMHIGLFSLCILKGLKLLKLNENKRYIVTICFIWFYAFLTGFSPSVLRAGLLFSLATLNKIFYTEIKSLNLLLLTGVILVFNNPHIMMNIGFIYSFLTTFGLIYGSKTISKHKILGVSLVAFLFSMPVTINNFYEINFLSIVLNIIFVPIVSSFIYPLCLVTFLFPFIEPITKISLDLLEILNSFCANLNFLHLIIPKMPTILIIIYYIVLLFFLNKKYNFTVITLSSILILNKCLPYFDNNYIVSFLDIGQGDSTLIVMPHRKECVLVDTGGKPNYMVEKWKYRKPFHVSNSTITYLHSLGINKINYMIITHGDIDHLGEGVNIINNIKVEKLILNKGYINYSEKKLINTGIPIVKKYKGDLNLKIFDTYVESDENSNSLISQLDIYDTRILLMGDAPKKKELEILRRYNVNNVDILKLGHHGSNTSSDERFIKSIKAKVGIISSGRKNKYGHPHKETIDTLNKLHLKYYNTQTSGTIEYKFNKKNYVIKEYVP